MKRKLLSAFISFVLAISLFQPAAFAITEEQEKQAFIDATIEATCMIFSSENLFDPTLEDMVKDIYASYGFSTDEERMEALAAKFQDDTVVQETITAGIEECAAAFTEAFGLEELETEIAQFEQFSDFPDVPKDHEYFEAINYLHISGIVDGYPDGTFGPGNEITRAEFLKVLVEASLSWTPGVADYNNCFEDVTDDWYAPYVCFAKNSGWVDGYPDKTFKPGQTVNKVEAIKMVLETQNLIDLGAMGTVTETPFDDVPVDEWFTEYVLTAHDLGLLEEEGIFYYPAELMKRANVSEMLYRAIFYADFSSVIIEPFIEPVVNVEEILDADLIALITSLENEWVPYIDEYGYEDVPKLACTTSNYDALDQIFTTLATDYSDADMWDVENAVENLGFPDDYLDLLDGDVDDAATFIAAYSDCGNILQAKLDEGWDPNVLIMDFVTPLWISVMGNSLDAAETLLKNGADPNFSISDFGEEFNALSFALETGNVEMVDLLISYGADLGDLSGNYYLLLSAIDEEDRDMIDFLLDAGADINVTDPYGGGTLLHEFTFYGPLSTIELLLEYGASVNVMDSFGDTPLFNAVSGNYYGENTAVIEALLAAGANIELGNAERGQTALNVAMGLYDVVTPTLLIGNGADVNATNANGDAPIHFTPLVGDLGLLNLLIAEGANVNTSNVDGKTALHEAGYYGTYDIAQALISKGADVNATNVYGEAPLHAAVTGGSTNIVQLLLDKNVNIDLKDNDGWSSLHFAVNYNDLNMVEFLIAEGAQVNIKNNDGDSPLDLAIYQSMKDILIAEGAKSGSDF